MEDYWIIVIVVVVWILLFTIMWRWWFLRQKQLQDINLHAPLHPESTMHRMDAARTKAMEGFTVCQGCGFENFKHSIFCMLCGETITRETLETKRIPLKHLALRGVSTEGKDEEMDRIELETFSTANGRRQRRAMKRREWTRALVEKPGNNNAVWEWNREMCGDEDMQGYVVLFREMNQVEIKIEESVEPEPAAVIDGEKGKEANEEKPIRATVKGRAQALQQEAETMVAEFIDAEEADASQFAVQVTYEAMETTVNGDLAMFQQQFHLDFPTKLAEFVKTTSLLLVPPDNRHIKLQLDRTTVVNDSLQLMGLLQPQDVRVAFRIDFLREQGVDAGGVYREWFLLLNQGLVQPDKGIFRCVDTTERTFYLNPHSLHDVGEDHLLLFYATGRLLGRALLEGNATGFHLALPLLKIMVGQPLTFHDLEYFDPSTYKSLLWLIENTNVHHLCLDFSICERMVNGDMIIIDLIPNGRNIPVNDHNKYEYIDRRFRYLLLESIQSQLCVFLKGLYEVIPIEVFLMLDAEELDYLLCGMDEIDVEDWERNTKYTNDLQDHPVVKWFWELVREMPNEYRRRLLQFTTGSSRVPITGFHALTSYDGRLCPFTLNGIILWKEGYLHSHACFNRLDLPRHTDRNQLKRVLYAMLDTEVYGFTTS